MAELSPWNRHEYRRGAVIKTFHVKVWTISKIELAIAKNDGQAMDCIQCATLYTIIR